ncbi:hypothetical protein [Agromyces archimandritae]|uniref:Lytic transglycosylase domain-containing protein n=1 Tax=Agromyces archimandritae TaxID=2781962 RepID=A0A975FMP3_9MICO|nr:hypothetical protein [Agromyces archimandritae]QTX04724.1 hypothetical protein G127AT_00125 [Agromyces archimandritae]
MLVRGRVVALAAGLLLTALLAVPTPAASADEDAPSWDEVEAAKQDADARAAEVVRIESLLSELTDRAAELGERAVAAAGAAEETRRAHDEAAARASALGTRADAAAAAAREDRERLSRVVARLARSGSVDPSMRLLLGTGAGEDAAELLDGLTSASRIAERLSGMSERARAQAAEADSLRAQADIAAAERERLAGEAEARAADAERERAAAEADAARTGEQADTLVAQLASLRDRSVDLERRYRAGVAAAEAAAERERAAPAAAGREPETWASAPAGVLVDPDGARAYAAAAIGSYGWGENEYTCLVLLWNRESSWRADALNPESGAYGIPQSLPAGKMASAGPDWLTNPETQIDWGLAYISGRYGAPCGAWAHSEAVNWY